MDRPPGRNSLEDAMRLILILTQLSIGWGGGLYDIFWFLRPM